MNKKEDKFHNIYFRGLCKGNKESFDKLYRYLFKHLYNIALYITKSPYLAEETISDVFTELWIKRENLIDIQSPKDYIFIMTRNRAFYYRKLKTSKNNIDSIDSLAYTVDILDPHESAIDELQYEELKSKLSEVINQLPERMRLIYYMVKEEGLSHKTIANYFDISERTVNAHITEATKRIRVEIESFLKL